MIEIEGHPNTETLKGFALGTLMPGMELLVSGHLTFCPQCRGVVAEFEELAAGHMALVPPSADGPSLETTLAMIDGAPDEPVATKPASDTAFHVDPAPSVLPHALHAHAPADVEAINWNFRLPGLYEYELPGFADETVSLLKAKPGTSMLSHTHDGDEATLILQGAMADGDMVLRRGDVAQADHHHDHKPHIVGNETCICLIVMSGKLRFTGTLTRALNLLMR